MRIYEVSAAHLNELCREQVDTNYIITLNVSERSELLWFPFITIWTYIFSALMQN